MLTSHGHSDHNFVQAVTLSGAGIESPFTVTEIHTWHDDEEGAARGENTITILEADGLRVVHLGDLGCRLQETQLKRLVDADAVMIPVGGFFTIDAAAAKELVLRLEARVVIPMHYRGKISAFLYWHRWRISRRCFPLPCSGIYKDSSLKIRRL